jgi:hypothetical protein
MTMSIKFTSFPENSNWVQGIVNNGDYYFSAKLFDEDSTYGIDNGRVSKLNISFGNTWDGFDNCFVNYDRGWDIVPEGELQTEVFLAVLDYLEASPTRFI